MSYPTVSVVISTMFENPDQLRAIAEDIMGAERKNSVEVIFISQVCSLEAKQACHRFSTMFPDHIKVICFHEKGLARSRNRGIEYATGDVILFGDTDCRYPPQAIRRIQEAYHRNPSAGLITFRAINRLDGRFLKSYRGHRIKHNLFSIMGVGSWEITFKRNLMLELGVRFDERFGLGSRWPSGAENIFMSDFLKKGGGGIYVPKVIVATLPSNDRKMNCLITESKGALLKRVWGIPGGLFGIPFLIRRHRDGSLRESFLKSVICLFRGWWSFPKRYEIE